MASWPLLKKIFVVLLLWKDFFKIALKQEFNAEFWIASPTPLTPPLSWVDLTWHTAWLAMKIRTKGFVTAAKGFRQITKEFYAFPCHLYITWHTNAFRNLWPRSLVTYCAILYALLASGIENTNFLAALLFYFTLTHWIWKIFSTTIEGNSFQMVSVTFTW